jgi:D-aminopeptidase
VKERPSAEERIAVKAFLSTDTEGITGVCAEDQTDQGHSGCGRAAGLMRGDLDAALAGCEDAGANETTTCSGRMRNESAENRVTRKNKLKEAP